MPSCTFHRRAMSMLVSFISLLVLPDTIQASWSVSTLTLQQLKEKGDYVRHTMRRDGILLVKDIPRLHEASELAFAAVEECGARTLAAKNHQGVFTDFIERPRDNTTEIGKPCDLLVTHEFRSLIHRTGADFAASLGPKALDFVRNGTHMEQFHHYKKSSDAMDVHTDAGVFIVMSSQWRDGGTNALYVTTPLNESVKVVIPEDTVVIMGGEAFGRSEELLGTFIHAVPHAPVIPADMGKKSRLWFGEMFLPAEDYDIAPNLKMDKFYHSENAASVACMYAGKMIDPRSMCPQDESLCWMACITMDCTCRNITSGGTCDSALSFHHPDCIRECPGDLPAAPFCEPGNDINMFMNGFNSILFGGDQEPCMLFYFQNWTIDSSLKFWLSFLGYALIGLFSEFIVCLRRRMNQKERNAALRLFLYSVNITLGYLVMLAAMTYSFEIFFAAILGLTIGHRIFSLNDKARFTASALASIEEIDNEYFLQPGP